MNKFRIIHTQPLTSILTYEVEESHRLWFLPWTVWRSLQERTFTGRGYLMCPRRFQTPLAAQLFTEQMLALRTSEDNEAVGQLDEQRQQLPRVIQVLTYQC